MWYLALENIEYCFSMQCSRAACKVSRGCTIGWACRDRWRYSSFRREIKAKFRPPVSNKLVCLRQSLFSGVCYWETTVISVHRNRPSDWDGTPPIRNERHGCKESRAREGTDGRVWLFARVKVIPVRFRPISQGSPLLTTVSHCVVRNRIVSLRNAHKKTNGHNK